MKIYCKIPVSDVPLKMSPLRCPPESSWKLKLKGLHGTTEIKHNLAFFTARLHALLSARLGTYVPGFMNLVSMQVPVWVLRCPLPPLKCRFWELKCQLSIRKENDIFYYPGVPNFIHPLPPTPKNTLQGVGGV